MAEALGRMLGGAGVACVGLWEDAARFDTRSLVRRPDAGWESEGGSADPARLVAGLPGRNASGMTAWGSRRTVISRESLPEGTRTLWEQSGVCSALAAPLVAGGGGSHGLLFVGFRRRRRFTGKGKRMVKAAGTVAGLALEKLAMGEKEQERARELGVMAERERLSREVHDSVIQLLGVVSGQIDAAEMASAARTQEAVWAHLGRAGEAARLGADEARRVLRALRPEVLEGCSGLPDALSEIARGIGKDAGIVSRFRVRGEARTLDLETEHAMLRVAQEALSNVRKHSGAGHVEVLLGYGEELVVLEIVDDGAGCEEKVGGTDDGGDNGGFGLRSMRERAAGVGGRLVVEPAGEGGGTRIALEVGV